MSGTDRMALALLVLGGSATAAEAPAAAGAAPPLYVTALPAAVSLVAWLPVDKAADRVDLDLRVEVVQPASCGDRIAGLLRETAAGEDAYQVVVERHAVGACKKEAVRIAARQAIRLHLPVGGAGAVRLGDRSLALARTAAGVTLDGEAASGDLPGAPPTARPAALVIGEAGTAKSGTASRIAGEAGSVRASMQVSARFPSCAGAPLGLLARGDVSTRFALTRFQPLARLPLDEPCRGTATRTARLETVVRAPPGAHEVSISVGNTPLVLGVR